VCSLEADRYSISSCLCRHHHPQSPPALPLHHPDQHHRPHLCRHVPSEKGPEPATSAPSTVPGWELSRSMLLPQSTKETLQCPRSRFYQHRYCRLYHGAANPSRGSLGLENHHHRHRCESRNFLEHYLIIYIPIRTLSPTLLRE
jgi:hypothetical protein